MVLSSVASWLVLFSFNISDTSLSMSISSSIFEFSRLVLMSSLFLLFFPNVAVCRAPPVLPKAPPPNDAAPPYELPPPVTMTDGVGAGVVCGAESLEGVVSISSERFSSAISRLLWFVLLFSVSVFK